LCEAAVARLTAVLVRVTVPGRVNIGASAGARGETQMNYGMIVAAGKSERMGLNVDKAFLTLGAKPLLAYSLTAFERCAQIEGVILVVRKDRLDSAWAMAQMFGCAKVKKVVAGGATRQNSVQIGLQELGDEVDFVSVHDGSRPMVTPQLIAETIESARKFGSGVAASKITDTIKVVDRGNKVTKTVDRTKLWAVQTPQTFRVDTLRRAFQAVNRKAAVVTDEASAVELIKGDVRLVPTSLPNIKVTVPEDMLIAAALLKG
jgi:2-C-methyl-D-erythritol 4-phosphate cytidylyltransferase